MDSADSRRDHYKQHLSRRCDERGITLSEEQCERLVRYVELLLQWRQRINLTGLREPERVIDVLIIESLDFLQGDLLPPTARVLDLGTGAGVPGVPLAVCAPRLHVTLLDRAHKKMSFLRRVVAALQLSNCALITASAEELARRIQPQEQFDAVVSRGVGTIALLLALAAPLVRPGGLLLLRKPLQTPELQEAAALLTSGVWHGVRTVPLRPGAHTAWALLAIGRASVGSD
jgi:16S rRNA (guanine527-N7)-methyltransferase